MKDFYISHTSQSIETRSGCLAGKQHTVTVLKWPQIGIAPEDWLRWDHTWALKYFLAQWFIIASNSRRRWFARVTQSESAEP